MNRSFISKDTGSAPNGSALALLRIPFVFTQDQLLRTEDFIKEARERGYELSLADLQELHRHRLLLPLFRDSDHPVTGRIIPVDGAGGLSLRSWALEPAREGRLRDCLDEGYSTAWPYARPEDEEDDRWWNGFLFSVWQVADLDYALKGYEYVQRGWNGPIDQRWVDGARRRTIVLAALATRHLPGILGKLSWPMGVALLE